MIEPDTNINMKYQTIAPKNKDKSSNNSKKTKKQKKRTQSGSLLNRYEFAYAGREKVNQLGKVTPSVKKIASSEINSITGQRINQKPGW